MKAERVREILRSKGLSRGERLGCDLAGACIDSRAAGQGQLFVALPGKNTDGHRFASAALEAGVGGALLSEPELFAELRLRFPASSLFLVSDPLTALQELAAARVAEISPTVVAITGSNGKTGTKDLAAALLSTLGPTAKSRGNLNNQIGLPLCLLDLEPGTRFLVAEMGCSSHGEISRLAELFRPEMGVVTNIGEAHLEELGDREGVFRAKSELPAALPADGLLLHWNEDPFADRLAAATRAESLRYGFAGESALRVEDLGIARPGRRGRMEGFEFTLPLLMPSALLAAAAAWGLARRAGGDPVRLTRALEGAELEGNRARLYRVGPWLVMDDSYNSNPDSLRAALAWLPDAPVKGRRLLALGNMLELGKGAGEIHRRMGREAADAGADGLFAFGPLAPEMAGGAREAGLDSARAFEDHEALAEALLADLLPGDLVLVKGSRGMAMERVVQRLEQAGGLKEEWR